MNAYNPQTAPLAKLLHEWQELYEQGQDIPAEELCDDPEQAATLQQEIEKQKARQRSFGTTRLLSPAGGDTADAFNLETVSTYELTQVLGRGGIGVVYSGKQLELNREVAIKFLQEDSADSPERVERFLLEAEVTSQLDHPGVAPVYGVGKTADGKTYYAMRRISGDTTLKEKIAEHHSRSWSPRERRREEPRKELGRLLRHLISASETLDYAHEKNLLNLDVKPQNIMVGDHGETIVLDWGEATVVGSHEHELLQTRNALPVVAAAMKGDSSVAAGGGTTLYMAPERLPPIVTGGERLEPPADGRILAYTDVYSLGVILYEILTGAIPYQDSAASESKLIASIHRGKRPSPREVNRSAPRALSAICMKAMETDPARRHQSANEFAADLKAWFDGRPVSALRENGCVQAWRFLRRHKTAATAALAAALLLAGYAVSSRVIAERDRVARDEGDRRRLAEERLGKAVATLENLTSPIANGEQSGLDVFVPMAKDILAFSDAALEDVGEASAIKAKLLELKSAAVLTAKQEEDRTPGELRESKEEKLRYLQQAKAIYESIASKATPPPGDSVYRLAGVALAMGRLKAERSSKLEEAMALFDQARRRIKELEPASAEGAGGPGPYLRLRREAMILHELAGCYSSRAAEERNKQKRQDDLIEAKNHYEESKEIRERLQKLCKENKIDRYTRQKVDRDLARSHGFLGDVHANLGEIGDAEEAYTESLKLRWKLQDESPGDPEHKRQYAWGLANFGRLEEYVETNLEKAIDRVGKAKEITSNLRNRHPHDATFRGDYASHTTRLAELHMFAAAKAASDDGRKGPLSVANELLEEASELYQDTSITETTWGKRQALLCDALLSETLLDRSPAEAKKIAQECLGDYERLFAEEELEPSADDLFVHALLQACLDNPEKATAALTQSVTREGRTAARYRVHRVLAFRQADERADLRAKIEKALKEADSMVNQW